LTTSKVTVSNLSFNRPFGNISVGYPAGGDSLLFSFAMTATGTRQTQYTQNYQSSASVLTPRSTIGYIQSAVTENNATNVSTIAAVFPPVVTSNSLLIAVEADQSTSPASIADNGGNTWTFIGSSTYPGVGNLNLRMYTVLNARPTQPSFTDTFAT